jgi:hypothetical protein
MRFVHATARLLALVTPLAFLLVAGPVKNPLLLLL